MQVKKNEIRVGVFLLVVLPVTLFVCLRVMNVTSLRTKPTYRLYATFDNIGGLKAYSSVRIGGTVMGRAADTTLDPKIYLPHMELDIDEYYNHILDTSSLTIRASDLPGEQCLALNVDFEDPDLGTAILKDGGIIRGTRSAIVLRDLTGQFPYNSKGDDNQDPNNDKAEAGGHTDVTPAADMMH